MSTVGCQSRHSILDKSARRDAKHQIEQRKTELGDKGTELFAVLDDKNLTRQEKEALLFLYAWSPISDLADNNGSYFSSMAKASLEARDSLPWGKKVPDELFRHFVLPPRVNNEDLDSARIVFFEELKERVKNMSMHDAALEVNHWCHEKITYRPSDSRTSSPLASLRTGYGRCGEESTFTVTALRSVGIPARQCYTPRWAHTDDNHAWVEVWCDGKWYFMGACEPESELNQAWFTNPVKRAMMVHTNVFGRYYGPESKTDYPLFTKINVLENYAETKKLQITVYDDKGNKVEGAEVKYLLYNYADYYPIYEMKTDKEGVSEVISGLGDLLVWAQKDGKYGYEKVSLTTTDEMEVRLTRKLGEEYVEDMDINPPVDKIGYVKSSASNDNGNSVRLKYEDSLRQQYLSTFMSRSQARLLAKECGLDANAVEKYILKSEGNWSEVSGFIKNNQKNENTLRILSTLTDKDLRDTPANILQSHMDNTPAYNKSAGYGPDVYTDGILSPRISLELIRKWRAPLQEKFRTVFSANPDGDKIKEWVNANIVVDNDQNYSKCPVSPWGVCNTGRADKASRDIFYVALCRSFNIPTKIDQATSSIQQYRNGNWVNLSLDSQSPVKATGNLILNYKSRSSQVPQYWSYYALAKFENGFFVPLDFENDARVARFPVELALEEGYYRLCTGNRYADGRVLAHNEFFNITKDKNVVIDMKVRELAVENKIWGTVNPMVDKKLYSEGGLIICFIDPDKEPTKHLMNELSQFKSIFDNWHGKFVFAIPEGKLTKGFSAGRYSGLPRNSRFITKDVDAMMNLFLKSADQSFRDNYPLIYIVNDYGDIILHSQGYKIGLGDLLRKTLLSEYSYI